MTVLHKSLALECHTLPSHLQEVLLPQGDLQESTQQVSSKGNFSDDIVCSFVITAHTLKVRRSLLRCVMLTVDSVDRRFCSSHEPEAVLYDSVGSNDAAFQPRRCKIDSAMTSLEKRLA